jgi:serine/threonine-protein kinase RsbT
VKDEGPGIPDIEKAMQEGYSTASEKVREMGFGAGMGLSNINKNTDKLEIHSVINKGTVLEMTTYTLPKKL